MQGKLKKKKKSQSKGKQPKKGEWESQSGKGCTEGENCLGKMSMGRKEKGNLQ